MAIQNATPTVWAGAILNALDTSLVYGNPEVINSDYEGDIQEAGDTVRIVTVGDVTISDYSKNTDLAAPEALTDAALNLAITQQKAFNFFVDDIDKVQNKPKLFDEASRRAGYSLRKVMDSYIASLYTDIASGNFIGSDASPKADLGTAGKAYEYLVDLSTKLDETDTPDENRWVVVPSWFHGWLEKDARFTGYGTAANRAALQNGKIGEAAGFTVLKSNQVPTSSGDKFKVIAGHSMGWSRAQQILKVVPYNPERRFGDALKGLHVYGAKVIRPNNLACLVANRA